MGGKVWQGGETGAMGSARKKYCPVPENNPEKNFFLLLILVLLILIQILIKSIVI